MNPLMRLHETGTYSLIISVSDEVKVNVGRFGEKAFHTGHYTYTGSAQGKGGTSLTSRLSRHLRTQKRKHWHIDYLLAQKSVEPEAAIVILGREKLECRFNNLIRARIGATTPISGFGASDCKAECESHLLHFPHIREREAIIERMFALATELGKVSSVRVFRFWGN